MPQPGFPLGDLHWMQDLKPITTEPHGADVLSDFFAFALYWVFLLVFVIISVDVLRPWGVLPMSWFSLGSSEQLSDQARDSILAAQQDHCMCSRDSSAFGVPSTSRLMWQCRAVPRRAVPPQGPSEAQSHENLAELECMFELARHRTCCCSQLFLRRIYGNGRKPSILPAGDPHACRG